MVSNCDAFYMVKPGDSCADIASSHGITLNQFLTWNPKAGSSCAGLWGEVRNCQSPFLVICLTKVRPMHASLSSVTHPLRLPLPRPLRPHLEMGESSMFQKSVYSDLTGIPALRHLSLCSHRWLAIVTPSISSSRETRARILHPFMVSL